MAAPRQHGGSAVAAIVVIALLGAGGFVAYRFFSASSQKAEIEKEVEEQVEQVFRGVPADRIEKDLREAAERRGCEVPEKSVEAFATPNDSPTRATVIFKCKMPVKLLVATVKLDYRFEKSRERSGAFKLMEKIKGKLEEAGQRHLQRMEAREKGAE